MVDVTPSTPLAGAILLGDVSVQGHQGGYAGRRGSVDVTLGVTDVETVLRAGLLVTTPPRKPCASIVVSTSAMPGKSVDEVVRRSA
jgi:hypothetical protein